MPTTRFYPDYFAGHYHTAGTWTDTRGDATSTSLDNTNMNAGVDQSPYKCWRAMFNIDTSSLGTDAIITAATFVAYCSYSSGSNSTYLIEGTQTSDTTMTTADYGSITNGVDLADGAHTLHPVGSWNTWTLNATGRGKIIQDGTTKLVLVNEDDFNDTTPGSHKRGATVQTQYLDVTYSVPETGSFFQLM